MWVVEPDAGGVVVFGGCPGTKAANPAAAAALSLAGFAAAADRFPPPLFKNGTKSDGILIIGRLI
jgi:hypothetical protein